MRLPRRVIMLVSLVVALTGCTDKPVGSDPPETPTVGQDRASVTGRIVDVNGVAIAGGAITVRATGEHATAGSDGAFVLDVPANTTLTLEGTAPNMASTLLPQFMVSPAMTATVEVPLVPRDHLKALVGLGANASGGAVVIELKSLSGSLASAVGSTVDITPSNLGKVMYMPNLAGMPDPDPRLTSIARSTGPVAWALGVQPHVSVMKLALRGISQVEMPYSIEDLTWLGTFTVEAGALTYLTVFTP